MHGRWWKGTSLLLVASLLLTSCGAGMFAGEAGVKQAAQEAQPKPPLEISKLNSPLPGPVSAESTLPKAPIRPFSTAAVLVTQNASGNGLPDAMLLAGPLPESPTPLPAPVGPSFEWSQTENYLVLGTDHRPGWSSWRTDVVILVGLDRANNRMAVFSIPRDTWVEIPGYGWGRINQVDFIGEKANPGGGGPKLVSQVLENTLGVATDHWVRVRMDGFVDVVNAVGGVTVHLDCPWYEPIFNLTTNAWDYFALPAGDVWMDGDTSYWFVRLRYRESDVGRNRRQRQFLWALRDQVQKTNLFAKFPELYGAFQSSFTTDLSVFDMLNLLQWGINLDAANVRAGGLSLYDLQNYVTPEGAQVLRIADPARVRSVVDSVWSAPAMVDANRQDTNKCPALPAGITFNTEGAPDLSTIDLDATQAGAPATDPNAQPAAAPVAPDATATPAETVALPTPTPGPQASTGFFPTPTPAPVSLIDPASAAGG
ncbi:MAG: LCP family protein [Anaerolineales bacterium]|nr:LCP family protein [Anaerolineales bacterium]